MASSRNWIASLLLWVLAAPGCSKEKLSELADQAKQSVTEQASKVTETVKQQAGIATDAAKEQLALAGNCELSLDTPLTTTACYVSFIPQESGRPNVLQVRSYKDAGQEAYPSVMFQAQVKVGGISELVGQTVSGQLFIQKALDAPVWSCKSGTHVDLKVISVDAKELTAEIVNGSLCNSQSSAEQPVTGKITGVLQ